MLRISVVSMELGFELKDEQVWVRVKSVALEYNYVCYISFVSLFLSLILYKAEQHK